MDYRLNNHIVGKVYDLTQDNMNAMLKDIEKLKEVVAILMTTIHSEYDDYYSWIDDHEIKVTSEYTDCISELASALKICRKLLEDLER